MESCLASSIFTCRYFIQFKYDNDSKDFQQPRSPKLTNPTTKKFDAHNYDYLHAQCYQSDEGQVRCSQM